MLHKPASGQKMFEVVLYNKIVRAMVKQNESHSFYDDQWADTQVRDVAACDETEARLLIAKVFPPDEGFVVERVSDCRL